jgi:hypothetical protein
VNTPDLLAVTAIVLLAAAYLTHRMFAGQRKKNTSGACAGCACWKDSPRPEQEKTRSA